MQTLKLRLILPWFFIVLFLWVSLLSGVFSPLRAQEAMPVEAVKAQELAPPAESALAAEGGSPVVVELFSSQACIFCPQADRLFAELVRQPNVIGLACHVDYFDVKQGALSKSFCSERQSWYGKTLHTGPNYTPQIVLQGQIDVVGYKLDDVKGAVGKAALKKTPRLIIAPAETAGSFRVSLPDDVGPENMENATLWVALYDKPHAVKVAEGRNKGKDMTYYNIASDLKEMGPWHEGERAAVVSPALGAGHGGFILLLQDKTTGALAAAGEYKVNE